MENLNNGVMLTNDGGQSFVLTNGYLVGVDLAKGEDRVVQVETKLKLDESLNEDEITQ